MTWTTLARRLSRALLGWSFDRLYRELAWAYDGVAWLVSGGRWRAWQRAVYPHLAPGLILEIGPGPGHLLAEMLARGHDAYGLELSPAMLRLAGRRLARSGHAGRLVRGNALSLPFAAGSFSSVVLTFPADYVLSPRFLSEAARVLGPDGRLVAVLGAEAGAWPWPGPLEAALRWLGGGPGGWWPEAGGVGGTLRLAPGLEGERLEQCGPNGTVYLLVATKQS